MKGKKCPYCGRRISYPTVFHEKKHGIYECSRCKKESKIKTSKNLLIAFLAVILVVVLYVIYWIGSGLYTNVLGILPPAILLIVFYFCTPLFIKFVPLKRFLSTEEKKPEKPEPKEEIYTAEEFVFDRKVFDEIKNKRHAPSSVEEKIDRIIAEEEQYVPVIEDVSEAHTSSQAPLKKMTRTYTPEPAPTRVYEEDDVKPYIPQKSKPAGSKYTANRKF